MPQTRGWWMHVPLMIARPPKPRPGPKHVLGHTSKWSHWSTHCIHDAAVGRPPPSNMGPLSFSRCVVWELRESSSVMAVRDAASRVRVGCDAMWCVSGRIVGGGGVMHDTEAPIEQHRSHTTPGSARVAWVCGVSAPECPMHRPAPSSAVITGTSFYLGGVSLCILGPWAVVRHGTQSQERQKCAPSRHEQSTKGGITCKCKVSLGAATSTRWYSFVFRFRVRRLVPRQQDEPPHWGWIVDSAASAAEEQQIFEGLPLLSLISDL